MGRKYIGNCRPGRVRAGNSVCPIAPWPENPNGAFGCRNRRSLFVSSQAAISALHAQARTPAETDGKQIAALYAELEKIAPVVALNHAAALGVARGPLAGLMARDQLQLDDELGDYQGS